MASSLREIAERSGYSINTVSRALRDEDDVKPETKKAIREIAQLLNYIPNKVATSLRLGRSNTIGIVSADSSNPFFAEVINGIEDAARSHDFHILLVNTEEDPARELEAIEVLMGRQVDGLLLMPVCGERSNVDFLKTLPIPFILVGRWLPGLEDHSVLTDEYEKAKEITSLFIGKGHTRILHLSGPASVSSSPDRIRGYRDALIEAGLPIDEGLIVQTDGHIESGHMGINTLVRKEIFFSAVFAFNDLVAIGALRALKDGGFRVPRDIEVIGYDDLDISRYLQLSLSSVHIPKQRLGRETFEELLRHIGNAGINYEKRVLVSRIMFRETTLFE
ncbi:MAG TPA: LacI family DNA-binding transcriptional regulator [Rectinemataceae bacterium]|nr:LacI family DNA-binding transcriptional regulator [Rectinemataceae bacterium]